MSGKVRDPRKLRNLKQYKDLSDEKFKEVMEEFDNAITVVDYEDFEERVIEKLEEFGKDYDLSDMKFNDMETLRALCQAIVALEDWEEEMFALRATGDFRYSLTIIDKLSAVMTNLRRDISKMQEDLKITRKIRQATREESARAELQRQKDLATKFYEKRMMYIYCEKCNMLLTTAWFLYPGKENTVSVKCNRQYTDDEGKVIGVCDYVTKVSSNELLEARGTNHPEGFEF